MAGCTLCAVSTVEQAEKNLSIPDQVRQLEEYCQRHKYEIVAIYREEGASASDDKRPEFRAMIDAIESGLIDVEAILVLTTSRFFRNVYQAMEYRMRLRKMGIEVISISGGSSFIDVDSPMAEAFEIIAATFDHMESRNIAYHTARGMRQNARVGYWNGNRPPYGYCIERVFDEKKNEKSRLRIDPEEAKVVRRVFALYTKNCMGALKSAKF